MRDYAIKAGGLVDLGEGILGKGPKNQARVRLVVYGGKGHKAAWLIATGRLELTANQVASL